MDPLQADIHKATRRAAHYWVQDGLQEALVGTFLVIIGAFLVTQGLLPPASPFHGFFAVGFPIVLVGLGVAVRRLVMRLKDRYVHPRTGYVSFQRSSRRAGWAASAVAGLVAFMVVLASRSPALLSWIPALQGLLFAAAFLYVGRQVGLARFPVQGVIAAAAGLGLALLRLNDNVAAGLLFLCIGASMAASGLLAFRAYLRHAPPGEHA